MLCNIGTKEEDLRKVEVNLTKLGSLSQIIRMSTITMTSKDTR